MLSLYYLLKKTKSKPNLITTQYYQHLNENADLKIEDVNGKCRVCLQDGVIEIFGKDDTRYILEAVENIGNIHINENDDYPKYLCHVCHEFIKGAILFKKIAIQSDEILKRQVKEEHTLDLSFDRDVSDSSVYDTKDTENHFSESKEKYDLKKEKNTKIKSAQKVTCKICNKVINRSYYKEHMTMHDPDHKKYVCDVCGKSFRLRCAYHNHSLRHRSDFPYKCQFCPYKGRYSELLKTHMRTHTGDYRYMCTECPARFLFRSNLNSHMLKHKEPQFKCESCKRAFHTKLLLQRHFEAHHLGIKNHVCNICGKAFSSRNAMMKHQRSVHKREKLSFGRVPAYLEAEHKNNDKYIV